jgi:hypothetical protein
MSKEYIYDFDSNLASKHSVGCIYYQLSYLERHIGYKENKFELYKFAEYGEKCKINFHCYLEKD